MECWQFNVMPRTISFTLREVAGVPVLWSRALMSQDVSPRFYAFSLTASVRFRATGTLRQIVRASGHKILPLLVFLPRVYPSYNLLPKTEVTPVS